MKLVGKRAVVTGGSRGIGLAIVGALASQGAEVIFTARSAKSIDSATASLPQGQNIHGVECDVTDLARMKALLEGPVDVLVNNAGVIGPIARIAAARSAMA